MELMDAGCLTEILGPDIDFPETHIAYVCKNVLTALSYLHRNNKLHRDIKSDNVLMNTKGEIKLADFGFAVGLTQEENRRKSVVGTPFWMAPELIRGTAYNKFSPKEAFTRGMLLTILARHDGVRTKDSTPWYASGCDWAARNGISDGKNPEEAVSREEFALTLYRYAQYRGSNLLSGNSLSSFTDASAVSDAALPAVQWAVSEAILRGDNFYLHPQSGATRAEAAAMLHRFFAR